MRLGREDRVVRRNPNTQRCDGLVPSSANLYAVLPALEVNPTYHFNCTAHLSILSDSVSCNVQILHNDPSQGKVL